MVCERSWFLSFVPSKIVIKTGNPDTPLFAEGHGEAWVVIGGKEMILHDCLLVPKISQKLVSLVRLIQDSITITKTKSCFKIEDSSGVIFKGDII
jgi:hypothetical protein